MSYGFKMFLLFKKKPLQRLISAKASFSNLWDTIIIYKNRRANRSSNSCKINKTT